MIKMSGRFVWSIEYKGKVLDYGVIPNGIIEATIDDLLDVYFSNGSPQAVWYLGLISDTNYDEDVGLDDENDTMASHAGWEEATNYTEATRPAWSPEVSVEGLKKNLDFAAFTISTSEDIRGMFLASDNEKDGVAGTLWATGAFTNIRTPPVDAIFKLYYELEAREG